MTHDVDAMERRVTSKVSWRLLPYLFLLYVVAYIDRINVGVAKEAMSRDLNLDPAAFGMGAGIFFIGYFLFEVPSSFVQTLPPSALYLVMKASVHPRLLCPSRFPLVYPAT